MGKFKFLSIGIRITKEKLTDGFNYLSHEGFVQIFRRIDQLGIKKGVDQLGLEKFINQCAILAAGSGAITGVGGAGFMAIGIPLDTLNIVTQQFRVTLAVSYQKTGRYQVHFDDFFELIARSLKSDAGVVATKTAMEEVAQKLIVNIGAKASKKLVPIVGGIIGGSANYLYIKRVADTLKNSK